MCVLYLSTDESKEKAEEACDMMYPIAEKYLEESGDTDADSKLAFLYSGPNSAEDDIANSLRGFLKLPSTTPLLFITNIPDQHKAIFKGEITAEALQKFVDDFKNEKTKWEPLRGQD